MTEIFVIEYRAPGALEFELLGDEEFAFKDCEQANERSVELLQDEIRAIEEFGDDIPPGVFRVVVYKRAED